MSRNVHSSANRPHPIERGLLLCVLGGDGGESNSPSREGTGLTSTSVAVGGYLVAAPAPSAWQERQPASGVLDVRH